MSDTKTIEVPFAIGDVRWWPRGDSRQVKAPCPVCAGSKQFVVEIAGGERLTLPCDACDVGMQGPRGYVDEWTLEPRAERFEIAGVSSMHAGRWYVTSTGGESAHLEDLRATEAEALAEAERVSTERAEENMRRRQHARGNVRKSSWSVRHHREKIRDAERSIEWHRRKLGESK